MLQTMRRSHHDSLHDYGMLNQEYGGARFMANLGDTRYNPTIRTFPERCRYKEDETGKSKGMERT
jgi:hypothetical protein